jgi:hypothetical protein
MADGLKPCSGYNIHKLRVTTHGLSRFLTFKKMTGMNLIFLKDPFKLLN